MRKRNGKNNATRYPSGSLSWRGLLSKRLSVVGLMILALFVSGCKSTRETTISSVTDLLAWDRKVTAALATIPSSLATLRVPIDSLRRLPEGATYTQKGGTGHGLGRAGGGNDRHPRRMRQPTSVGSLPGGETEPGARGGGELLKGERASGHPLLDDAQRVFDRHSGGPRPRLGSRPKKKSRFIIQNSKTWQKQTKQDP